MTDKKIKALNRLAKLLPKMSDYDLNMLICYGEGMAVKANNNIKKEVETVQTTANRG